MKPKFYKSDNHYYKVINDDTMLGIFIGVNRISFDIYSHGNIEGEDSLLYDTVEVTEAVWVEANKRMMEMAKGFYSEDFELINKSYYIKQ